MVCWRWLAGLGAEEVVVEGVVIIIRGSNGIRRRLSTRTTITEPQRSAKAPALVAPLQFRLRCLLTGITSPNPPLVLIPIPIRHSKRHPLLWMKPPTLPTWPVCLHPNCSPRTRRAALLIISCHLRCHLPTSCPFATTFSITIRSRICRLTCRASFTRPASKTSNKQKKTKNSKNKKQKTKKKTKTKNTYLYYIPNRTTRDEVSQQPPFNPATILDGFLFLLPPKQHIFFSSLSLSLSPMFSLCIFTRQPTTSSSLP